MAWHGATQVQQHTYIRITNRHRTANTGRLSRTGNEGDTGGITETIMRSQDGRSQKIDNAHGTNKCKQM